MLCGTVTEDKNRLDSRGGRRSRRMKKRGGTEEAEQRRGGGASVNKRVESVREKMG